ncbi:hypothetical protein [uncultured Draconibacterium sp.]|uniref:hypothetical protein n=1 Tax=uncultured Draconibacterium sp. TaxID=1573823 RepID=UPI0029C70A9D|nr:hypothetical protein [uncultured Draconibacterium sp.]
MIMKKEQIWDSVFDAIVMNDLYEINDENVEDVVDTITEWLYSDLFEVDKR